MSGATIKAIETHYKGYRFRSRLEARWAVFFDALGIQWEYEPEGFELPDGTRYLPDFWLPRLQTYIEIKGQTPSGDEYKKAQFLSEKASVWIVAGAPLDAFMWMFEGGLWIGGPTNLELIWHPERHLRIVQPLGERDWEKPNLVMRGAAFMAASRARSARFEHGERP